MIGIDRLISIINSVQIKEIGNLHFLHGPENLILNRDLLSAVPVDDLFFKIVQLAAHGRIIGVGHMVEK